MNASYLGLFKNEYGRIIVSGIPIWVAGDNGSTTTSTITISTTTTSTPQLCPIEELYGEGSKETIHLRNFRDEVLSKTPEGQKLIKLFYRWSPLIVRAMEEEQFKQDVKRMVDGVLELTGGR